MTEPFRALARAKLNLFLHVGPVRDDRYHDLFSLFVFAECGDVVSVEHGDDLALDIAGPFSGALAGFDVRDNLVWKAAERLAERAGLDRPRARLKLDKQLPVAAGIGGGSADAAAALAVLSKLWGLDLESEALHDLAFSLGADVPACLDASPVWVSGAGERLDPGPALPSLFAVLVNPLAPAPTGRVFQTFDAGLAGAGGRLETDRPAGFDDIESLIAFLGSARNDLERAAAVVAPEIGDVLDALRVQKGALLTRMSGSGATCFALFSNADSADAAMRAISAARPEWWVKSATVVTTRASSGRR